MIKKFLALLLFCTIAQGSFIGGGGSTDISNLTEGGVCTDDHFIRWDDAGGVFQCEAAPGAAGGNAWSDAVNSDILPTGADNTYDLGSTSVKFSEAHIYDLFLYARDSDQALVDISTNGNDTGIVRMRFGDTDESENCSFIYNAATPSLALSCATASSGNNAYTLDRSANTFLFGSNYDVRIDKATASRATYFDANKTLTASSTTATELGYVNGVTSSIQTQLDGKAPTDGDGIVEDICGHIETPDNKSYWLKVNAPYPFTINSITTDVDSGTATGALHVEGAQVTGCAQTDVSITSTEATDSCTAGNTVATGNDVVLSITSNSSSDDLRFCVKITRD